LSTAWVCFVAQTTSVRLLLNLVSNIYRNNGAEVEANDRNRALLTRIMSCLVHKFGTLQYHIPRVIQYVKQKKTLSAQRHTAEGTIRESLCSRSGAVLPALDVMAVSPPILPTYDAIDDAASMKDVKTLVKTMTLGLKTVLWCMANFSRPQGTNGAGGTGQETPGGLPVSLLRSHPALRSVSCSFVIVSDGCRGVVDISSWQRRCLPEPAVRGGAAACRAVFQVGPAVLSDARCGRGRSAVAVVDVYVAPPY
jgi:hypothetical protein